MIDFPPPHLFRLNMIIRHCHHRSTLYFKFSLQLIIIHSTLHYNAETKTPRKQTIVCLPC